MLRTFLLFGTSLLLGGCCPHAANNIAAKDLGQRILAAQETVRSADPQIALDEVIHLGQDQRYYSLVRGWLQLELEGLNSQLSAHGERQPPEALITRKQRIEYIIRRIDLE